MGTTLTGVSVQTSYDSLIKVGDNGPITSINQTLSDGLGTDLPIQVSTTDVKFTGNVDFDTATTSGIKTFKVVSEIRNGGAAMIPAGSPVYATGVVTGTSTIVVDLADASDPTKMPAIAITETDISIGIDGYAISSGLGTGQLSGFTGLTVNDTLYVAPGGGLTITKPTGTNEIQNIGIITKTNGTVIESLKITAVDRVNDIPNLPLDNVWLGDANGVPQAVNKSTLGGGDVLISGVPVNNQFAVWTNTNTIEGAVGVTYDSSSNIFALTGKQTFKGNSANPSGLITYIDTGWETIDTTFVGEFTRVGNSIAQTAGYMYNLRNTWVPSDANIVTASTGLLGIATTSANGNTFMTKGVVNLVFIYFSGTPVIGDPIYVGTNANLFNTTPPTGQGDVVRIVGYVVDSYVDPITSFTYYKTMFDPQHYWTINP